MADDSFDWGGLFSTALDIGGNIVKGLQYNKAQRKAAKAASGVGAYYGGMGYAQGGSYLPAMPGFGASAATDAFGPVLGPVVDYFNPSAGAGGRFPTTYTIYTTPSGRQAIGGMRSLGHPMLWSGDLAAARRVGRVARKLGRFVHHRRPR